ncbi:MAG: hypothetical protein R6V32_00920, partial [Bacteroidales bacterium]
VATMNITLSADGKFVERSRQFAAEHGTTLNDMIRNYMKKIARMSDLEKNAEEFAQLAKKHGGHARPDFVFDRDEIHKR